MGKSKAVVATEGKIDHFPAPPGSPLDPARVMTALAARPDTPLASKAIHDAGKVLARLLAYLLTYLLTLHLTIEGCSNVSDCIVS